jgi:hypothetical protein
MILNFEDWWKKHGTPNINWSPDMYKDVAKKAWDAAMDVADTQSEKDAEPL